MIIMDKQKIKNTFFTLTFIALLIIIFALVFLAKNVGKGILWALAVIVVIFIIFRFRIILQLKDYERAVIFRFGKVVRVGGPGWTFVFPFFERPMKVTLRVETIDIPPQEVLTKDNIQLVIDGVLFISVKSDPESVVNSVVKVEDYRKAATMFVIASLRDVVGEFDLNAVISSIEKINTNLITKLAEVSGEWGIKVHSVEISQVRIPEEILQAMHEQKAAVQKKLAVYELAESEKAKILAIKDATESLSEKTVTYYYIKALEKMAEGQSSKIIFPMELTNLLEKVSTNILHSSVNNITPETVERNIDLNQIKKYLPFIQSYITAKKIKTTKANLVTRSNKEKEDKNKKKGRI